MSKHFAKMIMVLAIGSLCVSAQVARADAFCDSLKTVLAAPMGLQSYRCCETKSDTGHISWGSTIKIPGATYCTIDVTNTGSDSYRREFPAAKWMDKVAMKSRGDAIVACVPGTKQVMDDKIMNRYEATLSDGHKAAFSIFGRMMSVATVIQIDRTE